MASITRPPANTFSPDLAHQIYCHRPFKFPRNYLVNLERDLPMLKFYESLTKRQKLAVAVPLPAVSGDEEADLQAAQPSIISPGPTAPTVMPQASLLNQESAAMKLTNRICEYRVAQKTESITRETETIARLNGPSVMLPVSAGVLTSYYKPENFLENPSEQAEQEESAQLFLESAWLHDPEFLPATYQFKPWNEQLVVFAKQEAREAAKIAVRQRLAFDEKPGVYFAAFWKRYGEVLDFWPEATKRIARYRLNLPPTPEAESVVKNPYFRNGEYGQGKGSSKETFRSRHECKCGWDHGEGSSKMAGFSL